jgi:hypothetical protein
MTVAELIKALEQVPAESEMRFAEYQDGQTMRWHISIACNVEHQTEIKQVWLIRNQHTQPDVD